MADARDLRYTDDRTPVQHVESALRGCWVVVATLTPLGLAVANLSDGPRDPGEPFLLWLGLVLTVVGLLAGVVAATATGSELANVRRNG